MDSICVENLNGKKTIVHKVESGENYFSISRKYNVTPNAVILYNKSRSLKRGTLVRVPTDRPFSDSQTTVTANREAATPSNSAFFDYKVGAREYLVSIARKFNTSAEEIRSLNNLRSDNLSIGQVIKIPYGSSSSSAQVSPPQARPVDVSRVNSQPMPVNADSNANAGERLKLPPARYGLREVDQHGVAIWITDETLDGTKMLALHQTAPIGTVIKITNPMTGKSTFTKVVGKFSQNESTRDAIIVITKAAADLVGAIDKRFQASIVYGVPNE